jgi:hypothetical protein
MVGFIDTFFYNHSFNHDQLQQLTINDCLRLAPFLTGLRLSSLPLWLTWFCFTNKFRMTNQQWRRTNHEWLCSPLHSRLYTHTLAVTMEHVCCLFVFMETRSMPSRPTGTHISIQTRVNFVATLWFPRVHSFHFSYPCTSLSNTQRRFVQQSSPPQRVCQFVS